VAMFLTRKYTEESLADIGSLYNRDHSTVLHAIKVITHGMARKTSIKEQMKMLCTKLINKGEGQGARGKRCF